MNSRNSKRSLEQSSEISQRPTQGGPEVFSRAGAEDHEHSTSDSLGLDAEFGATRVIPLDSAELPASSSGILSRQFTGGDNSSLHNGTTRFGDFLLLKKIGSGAMATVYKAKELSFDRTVALKILHPHIAENPKLVDRFYREARTAGHLDHPNIVQGYGVGEHDGWHYFNMEYVRGKSLQEWLSRRGRLPVAEAVRITMDCAKALDYAHDHGVIHRDIKPENVLITTQGITKIADLGMVKDLNETLSGTQTGHAVGTPWYMPLEQAKNAKDADNRCDIYALGCMLHCLLTGQPPFTGSNIVEILDAKTRGSYTPARKVRDDVPKRLDQIIAKMVARDPDDRFPNCALVVKYLETLELSADSLSLMATQPSTKLPTVRPSEPTPLPNQTVQPDMGNLWFLRVKNSEGRYVVLECDEAKIIKLIKAEKLSPSTKVSRSKNKGFRALATYKEFEAVTLGKATKNNLDQQTSKYRELYQQISDESDSREADEQAGDSEEQPWYTEHMGIIIWGVVGIASIGLLCWVFYGLALLLG